MDSLEVKQVFVCLPEMGLWPAVKAGGRVDPQGSGVPQDPVAGLDAQEAARAMLAGRGWPVGLVYPYLEVFTLSYAKYAASLCQDVLLTGHLRIAARCKYVHGVA